MEPESPEPQGCCHAVRPCGLPPVADFSWLMSAPFSYMSQFSCSSVMPGILFFTSSRFMVETPFVGCDHSFLHCSLSVFGLGRGTHRPLHGTIWRHRTSRFRFWRPALFQNELRRHEKALGKFCTVLENGQQKTTVRVHRGSVLFEGIHVQVCFRVSVHLL